MRAFNSICTYYVAPSGHNYTGQSPVVRPNGDGPFGSIHAVIEAIAELRRSGIDQPITVRLLPGEYKLDNTLEIGPTITNVTFESYDKCNPALITSALKLEGWQEDSFNGIPCVSVELPELKDGTFCVRDFFVNGLRAAKPRFPAEGTLKMADIENHDRSLFAPSKWFEAEKMALDGLSRESILAAEVRFNHFWIDEKTPVEAYDPENCRITLRYPSRFNLSTNFGFYLENVAEAFGKKGEFYPDSESGKLYYILRDGEDKDTLDARVPLFGTLLRFKGSPDNHVRNIRFRCLKFAYTTSDYNPSGIHGDESNRFASDAQAASNCPGTVEFEYAQNCAIAKSCIVNYGLYGVFIGKGCSEIRVARCYFFDGGAGGVRINGAASDGDEADFTHDNTVADCVIKHCGRVHMAGCGVIIMNGFNNRIVHNEISDLFYTGISCGWVWGYTPSVSRDNLILKNHIFNLGQGELSDMGGVYLLGAAPGTIVSGNIIHDIKSRDYGGWALYTDEGSAYVTLENNICYNCSDNCYHQHYGRMNVVRNNIFAYAGQDLCRISRFERHLSIIFEQNIMLTNGCPIYGLSERHFDCATFGSGNNLIWSEKGEPVLFTRNGRKLSLDDFKAQGLEEGSLIADPKFRDPANYDFTLAADSPAYSMGFCEIETNDVGPRKA